MGVRIDVPFASDSEIGDMVRLIESCELPGERWTHRAILTVAATDVARYPVNDASPLDF